MQLHPAPVQEQLLHPASPFNSESIIPEELLSVINTVNITSTPSPIDQVPYQILKRCTSLYPALLDLYNLCWRTASVPQAWKAAVITLIPKVPCNLRPIALTSCIGKLFTSIMRKRLHSHIVDNGYLDTNIQKAFQPRVPGCIEHYNKLAEVVHEAHNKHKSLTVCWLDLANAVSITN